ncbi:hypothetical protein J6590_034692 [Homalodisca vitripennis]|nr:hypothetical protein J6590_094189 [Homalodisca vitripennis]KAG8302379.1 hypothetical protein J6590_034692 [Homalodisca vitripennis]
MHHCHWVEQCVEVLTSLGCILAVSCVKFPEEIGVYLGSLASFLGTFGVSCLVLSMFLVSFGKILGKFWHSLVSWLLYGHGYQMHLVSFIKWKSETIARAAMLAMNGSPFLPNMEVG